MSAVDRIARQLAEQERRIGGLERSRSLSRSALVDTSIPVMETNPETGEATQVGEIGTPLIHDVADLKAGGEVMAEALGDMAERADQLDADLARLDVALTAVDGAITVAEVDPTGADADGKEVGSIWEVRAGDVTVRRFVLTEPAVWTQVVLGSDALAADAVLARHIAVDALDFKSAQGVTLTSSTLNGGHIYSPSATALPRVHIGDSTVEVIRSDGEGGSYLATQLGGATEDRLAMFDSDGISRAEISGDGTANFGGEVGVGDLRIAGRRHSDILAAKPDAAMTHSWASGNSVPQIGSSSYGLWRLTWVLQPGRRYKICMKLQVQGTPGDYLWFAARHTVGTTMPTVDTGTVDEAYEQIGPTPLYGSVSTTMYPTFIIYQHYANATQYNVLISARNVTADRAFRLTPSPGAQSSHVWLEDLGPLGGASAVLTAGGGTPYAGEVTPPDAPQPTPQRTEYAVSSWKNFYTSNSSDTLLEHGRLNGGTLRVAQLLFPAVPAGATNVRAFVKLTNAYTYYGAGMTAYVGGSTHGSLQGSSASSVTGNTAVAFARNQTREIEIVGWTAAHRSVWVGVGAPTGNQYFGRFLPTARIVYTYDL